MCKGYKDTNLALWIQLCETMSAQLMKFVLYHPLKPFFFDRNRETGVYFLTSRYSLLQLGFWNIELKVYNKSKTSLIGHICTHIVIYICDTFLYLSFGFIEVIWVLTLLSAVYRSHHDG